MIDRLITNLVLDKLLNSDKIILIFGARQVGKTTLVRQLLPTIPGRHLVINADEIQYTDVLSSCNLNRLNLLVEGYDLLFIDEAQRIPEVGLNLKIMHDALPNLKIIATGSSAFELANRTKESLAGRTWTFSLYPIALVERLKTLNAFEVHQLLDQHLVFGLYPGVLSLGNQQDKIQYLQELTTAYLYKDILDLTTVRYADKLRKLVQLLAFQIGSEVSIHELSNALQLSRDTVNTYIDLLEKAFVVFRLPGFSRNLRKEITKMDKVFFYDLGIRNALINNFNPLDRRNDVGQLWENFLVVERLKTTTYRREPMNRFFWRTYTGAELDYVEERGGELHGFEFKFSAKTSRPPASWPETYPGASF